MTLMFANSGERWYRTGQWISKKFPSLLSGSQQMNSGMIALAEDRHADPTFAPRLSCLCRTWRHPMRFAIEFPLVKRQLLQTSQRKRLWYTRGLLTFMQLLVGLVHYDQIVSRAFASNGSGIQALGSGGDFIVSSTICNLILIYLLMPLTACSAISDERSRQTLPLLLISRISPAMLVWEKFLWSLQLVFSMILASLPVLALGYSLGGMPAVRIALCALTLFTAAIQVNSAAIFWSSLTDKSVAAFWGTLLLLFLVLCVPPILSLFFETRLVSLWNVDIDLAMLFSGFWMLTDSSVTEWPDLFVLIFPPLALSMILLFVSGLLVSVYRWEPPFVQWRRFLINLPREWKRHSTDAVPVSRPRSAIESHVPRQLLQSGPIEWRECRSSITTRPITHVVLSVVLLGLVFWLLAADLVRSAVVAASMLQMLLLFLGAMQVQSLAARAIGTERERETLQVLLTTPIPTREILRQKFSAASRVRNLLMIPFAVLSLVSLTADYWPYSTERFAREDFNSPFVSEVLLLLIIWQQLTFALRVAGLCSVTCRTPMRATGATVGVLFAYCIGQFITAGLMAAADTNQLIPGLPLGGLMSIIGDSLRRTDDPLLPIIALFGGMVATQLLCFALQQFTRECANVKLERAD